MYQPGDMIIYGSTGVCEVKEITTPDFEKDKSKLYYALSPVYQDGMIYTPVDTKAFMRPIMTREEVDALIDRIPTIETEVCYNRAPRELQEHYDQYLKSHSCEDLLGLAMSIYTKREDLLSQRRKFGAVDERYMKRAEDLLDGEFAVALGIEKNQVGAYITARVDAVEKD